MEFHCLFSYRSRDEEVNRQWNPLCPYISYSVFDHMTYKWIDNVIRHPGPHQILYGERGDIGSIGAENSNGELRRVSLGWVVKIFDNFHTPSPCLFVNSQNLQMNDFFSHLCAVYYLKYFNYGHCLNSGMHSHFCL